MIDHPAEDCLGDCDAHRLAEAREQLVVLRAEIARLTAENAAMRERMKRADIFLARGKWTFDGKPISEVAINEAIAKAIHEARTDERTARLAAEAALTAKVATLEGVRLSAAHADEWLVEVEAWLTAQPRGSVVGLSSALHGVEQARAALGRHRGDGEDSPP